MNFSPATAVAGFAVFGVEEVIQPTGGGWLAGAALLIGAIATLFTAFAAFRRSQRTREQVEGHTHTIARNSEKIDKELAPKVRDLERDAVRREELETWREVIATTRELMAKATEDASQVREKWVADMARADERYRQMQEQYIACEEGRVVIMAEMARLRGEFEEFRRAGRS